MKYAKQLKVILSPVERRAFSKLNSPKKVQDFLDSFPINKPGSGDSILSPRDVLSEKKMHCMEGAVLAAAALASHNLPPLLMDFQTTNDDEDHVVALFKIKNFWGAISKTNHPVLRWRDPIYKTPRELALSYFHEYYLWSKKDGKRLGTKTLRAYSKPFDLRKYKPEVWFAAKNLDWLAEELDASPHLPIYPKHMQKFLRKASKIETDAMKLEEWS
ncbi:hypothetical protein KW798_01375 [Candidatus Parcubacteria bacterium]|nr:hypothetical protein [Candidatus Parcubacteria bacterium]